MHLHTHVIHSIGKPLRHVKDYKKAQFRKSYALAKSAFHMKPLVPFRLHVATISPVTTALSTNCLPLINDDWKGSTGSSTNSRNLLASTFAIIR